MFSASYYIRIFDFSQEQEKQQLLREKTPINKLKLWKQIVAILNHENETVRQAICRLGGTKTNRLNNKRRMQQQQQQPKRKKRRKKRAWESTYNICVYIHLRNTKTRCECNMQQLTMYRIKF